MEYAWERICYGNKFPARDYFLRDCRQYREKNLTQRETWINLSKPEDFRQHQQT